MAIIGPEYSHIKGPWGRAHGLMGPWAHVLMDLWAPGPRGPWAPRSYPHMGPGPNGPKWDQTGPGPKQALCTNGLWAQMGPSAHSREIQL